MRDARRGRPAESLRPWGEVEDDVVAHHGVAAEDPAAPAVRVYAEAVGATAVREERERGVRMPYQGGSSSAYAASSPPSATHCSQPILMKRSPPRLTGPPPPHPSPLTAPSPC